MRTRSIKKQVWLNSRENELLKKKCLKAGLSESAFFRHVINDTQIKDIKELYFNWQAEDTEKYSDIPELCKTVKLEEIREKDYSLIPSKYIEFIDHDLDIDFNQEMTRIQSEMKEILLKEENSQAMLIDAFRGIGYEIK